MKPRLFQAGIAVALAVVGMFVMNKISIENGVKVPEAKFPYLVKLVDVQATRSKVMCAGIAIDERRVLTAAHCVPLVNQVRPADNSALLDFSSQVHNDLALLFITHGKLPQHWTNPILKVGDIPATSSFVALGYGGPRTDDANPDLRRSNLLSFQPVGICEKLYSQTLQSNEICVGRQDMSPCRYDSGGPLFTASGSDQNPVLISLVGVVSKADTDCKDSGPAIFTAFEDDDLRWIESLR